MMYEIDFLAPVSVVDGVNNWTGNAAHMPLSFSSQTQGLTTQYSALAPAVEIFHAEGTAAQMDALEADGTIITFYDRKLIPEVT
jgi:hypothetical protein